MGEEEGISKDLLSIQPPQAEPQTVMPSVGVPPAAHPLHMRADDVASARAAADGSKAVAILNLLLFVALLVGLAILAYRWLL